MKLKEPPEDETPRQKLWRQMQDLKPHTCPTCEQNAQIYRRQIHWRQAWTLCTMYRLAGKGYLHMPSEIPKRAQDFHMLAYWGLIEDSGERRDDTGRAGYWRVTPLGEEFILDGRRVGKYVHVYDGEVVRRDYTEWVSITDALGTRFNLQELLTGEAS